MVSRNPNGSLNVADQIPPASGVSLQDPTIDATPIARRFVRALCEPCWDDLGVAEARQPYFAARVDWWRSKIPAWVEANDVTDEVADGVRAASAGR